MLEAMYGIEFVSNTNDVGYGVVILETGRVLGGDSSFVFVGKYEVKNGIMHTDVKCTNDRNLLPSFLAISKSSACALKESPTTRSSFFKDT